MEYKHTTITIDGRCLDLLLTEDEITTSFERTLEASNQKYIDMEKCCVCWPINKPPECAFWRKILGLCEKNCD